MRTTIGMLLLTAGVALGETFTLEQAIATALAGSPSAKVAEARIEAAAGVLMQAQSAFQPKVALESSYLRTNQPVSVFGFALNQRSFSQGLNFNDVPDADNWNARAMVTMPIYAGGRNQALREVASAGLQASRLGARVVEQELVFEVTQTFLLVRKTRALQGAADAAVKAFETNAELARQREKGGTALKADLLDVEVRLAQAQDDVVQVRNANELARHALRNLLGLESGSVDVAETLPKLGVPGADAMANRPEFVVALEKERALEAGVDAAKAGGRPQVNAFGSVENNRGSAFDGQGSNYTVGVVAQWNLWDGRLTKGKVAEATAELLAAREETRKVRLGIALEVDQARLGLRAAEERLRVSARVVEQADESVKLTRERFEQGLGLASQLIDAETALTGARVRRVEAETNRLIAVAALRRSLGMKMVE
jgi:outer membrane protein